MTRTIADIKKEMTDYFVRNETIQSCYELNPDKSFDEQFSKVGLENIIFNTVAACLWTLEKLFDRHKQEVAELINELKPHSLRWYVNKAKAFQFGRSLITDTDQYDNTGLSHELITQEQAVKYAAAVEKAAIVYIKVAGGSEGNREQLSSDQEIALGAYLNEVKDAGVKLNIINIPADEFNVDIDIYYDSQVFDNTLNKLDGSGQIVHDTIASMVENLPFNGEYRNSDLINILTELDGVEFVELKQSSANGQPINARYIPEAGYFQTDKNNLGITAIAYETVSN